MSLFVFDVDRRASGQNDAESHEKLAQRIEKDVVSDTITLHCLIMLYSSC